MKTGNIKLYLYLQTHGTVIRTQCFRKDICIVYPVLKALRDAEIVDSPAGILFSGLEHVGPPGICVGLVGINGSESIHKTIVKQLGKLLPFLVGKTRICPVCFRILQIDLPVGHIEVPAQDHRLLLLQLLEIRSEIVLPLHSVVKPFKLSFGIWSIHIHKIKSLEFQSDYAALIIVLLDADTAGGGYRFDFGKYRSAGIAFFLRIIPELVIALKLQLYLTLLQLGFLQAEYIGISLPEKI